MYAEDTDGAEMRVLIPNSELDEALKDFGAVPTHGFTIEEMRLIIADVTTCLACAVTMGDEIEFDESMAGMKPCDRADQRVLASKYLDYLLDQLRMEDFSEALGLDEVQGRVAKIREWIEPGSACSEITSSSYNDFAAN